jgi:hypothetical protein
MQPVLVLVVLIEHPDDIHESTDTTDSTSSLSSEPIPSGSGVVQVSEDDVTRGTILAVS